MASCDNSFSVSPETEKFLCDRLIDPTQPISERFRASSLFATSVALLLVKRSFSVRFHYTTVGVFNYAFEFVGVIFSEFALKMAFN
ncbi:hypothetical protein CK203_008873 [Vitis vinifera]|uniref:Uncharacterized protein n=1 Tax=Vitis vinifera TaxID=29760 RepID=A0A438KD20_VITVI|nr:hypothetical protein CK203_008873 [Vitis vinifera]